MATDNDVRMNGGGSVGGGSYDNVTINGTGVLNGDLTAANVRINGSASARGDVSAEAIVVNGTAEFKGSVSARVLDASGSASVGGDLDAGKVHVKGSLSVAGGMKATDVILHGMLEVAGDCQTETLIGDGAFDIGGLLNAGRVEVRIYGPCKARDIGCERIGVKPGRRVAWFRSWMDKRLTADTIEGDAIVLEYTTANVVRGHDVRLGTGCDVALVEYSGTFVRADDAKVGEARKLQKAAS